MRRRDQVAGSKLAGEFRDLSLSLETERFADNYLANDLANRRSVASLNDSRGIDFSAFAENGEMEKRALTLSRDRFLT